jgi:hypothetical protein
VNKYTIRINEQQLAILSEAMRDLVFKRANEKVNPQIFQEMLLRTMLANDEDTRLSKVLVNDFTQ